MRKILIIEDDPAIRTGLSESLNIEGYKVTCEESAESGLNALKFDKPDLIILDVMLPGMSGFEFCKQLRSANDNTFIIMLTAKNEEIDKILGLELGADDYVTKPFSIRELTARIKAVLKRKNDIQTEISTYLYGGITIDFKKMECMKNDKKVNLSFKEFEIMKFFIKHEEELVTRNQLLDEVWGYETFPTTRTVDNYILMLRKKLEENPSIPKHIQTIHNAGYKFVK
jgi:DNA-binding response OmpR family regulator